MKYFIFACVFALFAVNADAGSITLKKKDYPQIKGVQVFVLDAKYKNNLESFVKAVKKSGANTIMLRVFHNTGSRYHYRNKNAMRYGVYFKTSETFVLDDTLGDLIKAAKKHDIKVYAWMATRTLSFLTKPGFLEREYGKDGKVGYGYGANIFHQYVRKKILRIFRDLAKYDIDGILFQDDFILRYREGASSISLKQYKEETGVRLTYRNLFGCGSSQNGTSVPGGCPSVFIPWANWKMQSMAQLFEQLRLEVLKINPSVRFAANIYYETPSNPGQGLAWYSQNIRRWLEAGFDYFAVMCYQDQIKNEMGMSSKGVLRYIDKMTLDMKKQVRPASRIMMKVQRMSWKTLKPLSDRNIRDVCRVIDNYGNLSKALVPVNEAEDIYDGCFK